MKKFFAFFIMLLLVPAAFAEDDNERTGLKIVDIKGYVNDDLDSRVDKDGGTFRVYPKDDVDIQVEVFNDLSETTQVKIKGVMENINDGDDITKEIGYYDIDTSNSSKKMISFRIPNNVVEDEYDFTLYIYSTTHDGNESTFTVDYYVDVRVDEEEEKAANVNEILLNMSRSCEAITESTNACFNYIGMYDNCSDELSGLKEERGTYQADYDNCQSLLDTCQAERDTLETDNTYLSGQQATMISLQQCNMTTMASLEKQKRDNDSKSSQTLLLVGAAGVGLYLWTTKKKEKSSVAGSFQRDVY